MFQRAFKLHLTVCLKDVSQNSELVFPFTKCSPVHLHAIQRERSDVCEESAFPVQQLSKTKKQEHATKHSNACFSDMIDGQTLECANFIGFRGHARLFALVKGTDSDFRRAFKTNVTQLGFQANIQHTNFYTCRLQWVHPHDVINLDITRSSTTIHIVHLQFVY